MSRELKFKCYNDVKNIMFDVKGWTGLSNEWEASDPVDVVESTDGIFYPKAECRLMQYTGLKDKNGKEIYEGYIVRFTTGSSSPNESGDYDTWTEFGKIIYNEDGFRFQIEYGDMDDLSEFLEDDTLEVMGNIHENPELLEEEQ